MEKKNQQILHVVSVFVILTLIFTAISQCSVAQTLTSVSGIVKDTTNAAVPGAVVKLFTGIDSTSTVTNTNGSFSFSIVKSRQFKLRIIALGYQSYSNSFVVSQTGPSFSVGTVMLKTSSTLLNTVNIVDVNPVKLKEDTVEFNANAYKVRQGAPVEDMLKKLPGVDVDKSGNVTSQGKTITKVRVNGKDFFGGDVKTATQNLPAELVQNIQVIDDYGDQANLTGIKSGDPEKVLNINIRPDKNYGYFGQATAGEGGDAQQGVLKKGEDNRYVASANLFSFNGDRQIAALANFNNTNTSLFSFGSGGPRGGGPGGPPPGAGSSSNTNGITTARSIGLNYRDQWGKKVTVYGNYSFADNTTNTISSSIQTNNSLTSPSVNNVSNNQTDGKTNHRFNFNLEYKIDTINYLKITPNLTYAGVNTDQTQSSNLTRNGSVLTNYNLNSTLNSTSPNYGGTVLYNHRFNSHGRNFSISASGGSTWLTQTQNPVYNYLAGIATAPANQLISTDVKLDSVGTTLSYIEPLSKRSYLEATYAYKYSKTTSDKETDTLTANGNRNRYNLLSNDFYYTFVTNRFGLNYRFIEKKYNYSFGVSAQPATLIGHSVTTGLDTRNTTYNFAPFARMVYNFSRNQSFVLNYNGSNNQPTYSELQPVIDFSSASYPIQGNPYLKPEFNNVLSLRYNKFSFETGNVFFSNLSFTQTNNKIVANSITYPSVYTPNSKLAGTILTQYLNAAGFYSATGSYMWAKPWEKRKYTLFLNGNVTYNNNISYISNVSAVDYAMRSEKNIAKNLILTQGARFRADITDVIDAEANASYSLTKTDNSLSTNNINNNFRTITLGVSGKNYFFKDWTLSYDFSKVIYQGYQGATNPNILNAYVERRFLKQNVGTLRLSAFDLFNQNTGFTTTQTGSYITQSESNRLGRYFLLSFTLRLQKFAGKRPFGSPGDGPGGMRGPGGFGGPPPAAGG
ncbi:TonB-dependent receptor family protein [Mucilaginibacter sp. RS28]|uniref:TonB-dependent receptor family protein n=1 Tax=Mucilaginibacter straminoryzae TaxID=2932774 RepID=A0A9X1X3I1_9SPHI|nr:TonB-dependent receptor [Mucilaginibacter straminoryzae]MCJ8209600.1 TonB-dependent receptor family protein [Mucilaginibacter straminoryzae]